MAKGAASVAGWRRRLRARWVRVGLITAMALLGAAPVTLAMATETHVVGPGETLSDIADHYGISVDALASQNGIADPNLIFAGQELRIGGGTAAQAAPLAPVTHVVGEGETLTDIANLFGTTVGEIVRLNGVDNPDQIAIGRELRVPAAAAGGHVTRAEARAILRDAETEFGLPRGLLLALAWQESGWQQTVTSDAGAIGITQLLPATADWAIEQFVPDAHNWRGSATDNARMGAAVLAYYLRRSSGDERMALAAYYQGWKSVSEHGFFDETVDYVDNVIALQTEFQ
jgi:LysM repeat protein